MAAKIYKQDAKVNLPSDNAELEDFFWQVEEVRYNPIKEKTRVQVRHWFGAKEKRNNGLRWEVYTVNNIVPLGQIEAKALTLPQYIGSNEQ